MEIEEIEFTSKYYPRRLREIKDAPEKLYVLGNKEILNDKGIAIVGSRDCTELGKKNAKMFGANIASSRTNSNKWNGKRNRPEKHIKGH